MNAVDNAAGHYGPSNRFAVAATPEERNRGTLVHLLGLLGLIDMFILGLVGTLILYLTGRHESAFADDHAREAVNFQLSLLIYACIGWMIVLVTLGLGVVIMLPIAFAAWVFRLVVGIMASVAANRGEYFRYPMCIRFLR